MKNGILGPNEGFMILIDGVDRTFRDVEPVAYASAAYLKERHPKSVIQVRHLEDGRLVTVEAAGAVSSAHVRPPYTA